MFNPSPVSVSDTSLDKFLSQILQYYGFILFYNFNDFSFLLQFENEWYNLTKSIIFAFYQPTQKICESMENKT